VKKRGRPYQLTHDKDEEEVESQSRVSLWDQSSSQRREEIETPEEGKGHLLRLRLRLRWEEEQGEVCWEREKRTSLREQCVIQKRRQEVEETVWDALDSLLSQNSQCVEGKHWLMQRTWEC
jgi:hypothetical protein